MRDLKDLARAQEATHVDLMFGGTTCSDGGTAGPEQCYRTVCRMLQEELGLWVPGATLTMCRELPG